MLQELKIRCVASLVLPLIMNPSCGCDQIMAGADRKRRQLLKAASVVGVTCCSASLPALDGQIFEVVILDECSQIVEPLSLMPIVRARCRCCANSEM